MATTLKSPRAFVAIPCGDYYEVQAQMIRDVAVRFGVDAYIAEDDPGTKGLWESIKKEIDEADIFIADITSGSPNILCEVGYAIGRKPVPRIGLFLTDSSKVPPTFSGSWCRNTPGFPVFAAS